jgi:hypothetical protein
LAKEGFKTFQGLASDERNMHVESINTILYNPKHIIAKYIGQTNITKCQEEAKKTQLTVEELRILLSKITRSRFVQLTGPPYRIKYHTQFLQEFNRITEFEQPRTQSQENPTTAKQNQEDSDDESTIVPPSVIQATTPTPTEPSIKKSHRNDETEENQVTLRQIWTPRPTQVLEFDAEATQPEESGLTEEEIERQRKLAAVVNPYSQRKIRKTPMVTPQKVQTHTKNKYLESATRTNLKDPPKYPTPDKAPTQELEDIVTNNTYNC